MARTVFARALSSLFICLLRQYGHCDANAGVAYIEQEISAVDVIDVSVIGVSPATRPGLRDFEAIAAIGKVRPAFDHINVTDGEMMFASEVGAEMFVGDAAVFFARMLFMVLFLPRFLSLLVMFFLRKS